MKIAVVITCFRYRSHAHVFLENFLEPYLFNGKKVEPNCQIVSMYVDQFLKSDMSRDVARRYGIKIYPTIAKALCLGGRRLNVDAVLSIAEHGSYSINRYGQKRYPRKRFFDQIADVMRSSKRSVPVFMDKHLSYRWDWAKDIYDTSQELKIPIMVGSSVPLAQRRPSLELPRHAKITEALSMHGGEVETYGFHALEVLQSMVEARQGGETGVASVEYFKGKRLYDQAWSQKLANAAIATELGKPPRSFDRIPGEPIGAPQGWMIRYVDGLKAMVYLVGRNDMRWNFACRLAGERQARSTHFYVGPWRNRNLFKALSHTIQHHFHTGRSPYPVERTLLTTGLTEALMRAREQPGQPLSTPHLEFSYKARNFKSMREMGASWNILTDEIPEPRGLDSFCG